MRALKETLKQYRVSIWLCVLSCPVSWLILMILEWLQRFCRRRFPINADHLFVWVMGTIFFVAFVSALDTFAKEKRE